jgi:hypothetical protein
MLSSAGVQSSAAPSLADKILALAHSHGFNAVLYALTGSGLVMAGVKWFWPGTSQARLYAIGAIALAVLLPLAYFFAHESSPFAGKWVFDATESRYSSSDVPSAATVTVTEDSSNLKVTEDRVLDDHKTTHLNYTLHLDGKDRPTPRGLTGDSMAASATGNTLTITYNERGRELAREKLVVSADQKQMTVSFLRHTAKGDVEDTSVYDKK